MIKKRKVSIRVVGDRFIVDYRDFQNKRHRAFYKTKKEALRAKSEAEFLLSVGPATQAPIVVEKPITQISIKEAINRYVQVRGLEKKPDYRRTEKWHFELFFDFMCVRGNFEWLHEIDEMAIDNFAADLNSKRAGSTVNRVFATLRPFFKKCVRWGLIAKSPTDHFQKKTEDVVPIRAWPKDLKKAVIEKLHPKVLDVIHFQSITGCRPADAWRTNWGDLDFERRLVRFRNFKGGRVSETYWPMPDELHTRLYTRYQALRREFKARDDDPVFLNLKGQRWTTDALSKHVREAIRACGVEDKSLYGLRHTFITELVDLGVHPRDIKELARHRKFETTIRYTQRNVEHLREVVNRSTEAQKIALEG